jgi:hypothetical protein
MLPFATQRVRMPRVSNWQPRRQQKSKRGDDLRRPQSVPRGPYHEHVDDAKHTIFSRIRPSRCIYHIEESTAKTGKPLPTRVAAPQVSHDYSPPIHGTGSTKPKESLRYNLARHQLLYSSRTLALMASTSARAPLNTTSLRCLQMHQKSKMMEVHKSLCVTCGHGREVHQ